MPVLDIGDWKKQDKIQKWITSKKVWAAMCFPNDQVLQNNFVIVSIAEKFLDSKIKNSKKLEWQKKYLEPNGGLRGLMDSNSKEDIQRKVAREVYSGMIAGETFLFFAVLADKLPQKNSNKKMSKGKASFIIEDKTKGSITRHDAEKYWDKKKPVIHLWAAFSLVHDGSVTKGKIKIKDMTTPEGLMAGWWLSNIISPNSLDFFLSIAELFKKKGLNFYPRDKRVSLLNEDELYSIPKKFELLPMRHIFVKGDMGEYKNILEKYSSM